MVRTLFISASLTAFIAMSVLLVYWLSSQAPAIPALSRSILASRSSLAPLVHLRVLAVAVLLAATLLAGSNIPTTYGMGLHPAAAQKPPAQGKPHHVDPKSGARSTLHKPPAGANLPSSKPLTSRPTMSHGFAPTMKPGTLKLDPNKAVSFIGSDGRLEVDAPAGAITTADVATASGKILALRITEVAPPSGSNAGSGATSLGSYTIDVVDGSGARVGQFAHGLRKGITLKLHYGARESALELDHAFVVVNGAHPRALTNLGPYSTEPTMLDAKNHVIQAQLAANTALPASAPSATPTPTAAASLKMGAASPRAQMIAEAPDTQQTPSNQYTFNTYAPVAKFGAPDPLNVDLNAGSLTEGIQLDVPPGPAGAMPNLTLAYNSASVSEQHSPQGAAGWVGEGWSLSLGSITWAEHDVNPTCTTSCTNTWQGQWMLNDPFGTSTELIPPNLATSTYYDDSINWWCGTGNAASVSCPIRFQTADESYAKIFAYVGPIKVNGQPDPFPCFRVYLRNGVMEEFGCTADSMQYYPILAGAIPQQGNSGVVYPVGLMLDLITNPQGDQVHITYQRDTATLSDGTTYPRDVVPATIEWDSPGCVDAKQMCTGSAWQPHYRVQFSATHHTVTRLTNSPTGCNPDATVRCDDPQGSADVRAPLVNGTFVLNDAYVQTNTTSGGSYNSSSWNTVRDYQFSYEQSGPITRTDPPTGKVISYSGYLDLTKFQEVGDNGSMAYPATTFGYSTHTEYYEDGSYVPSAAAGCGPSWNTGGNGGTCDLWSQTRDGNSRYLTTISNGQGLQQTITWSLARNNTHGANSGLGADIINPLYCDAHPNGYPCNSADDQAWSRIVVTGRSDTANRLTQAGQGGAQTTTPVTSAWAYTYTLSMLTANECGDCVAGMYWGNQNDGDYLDYYNGHFMGFTEADVSNPDGSVVEHHYEATEGWGVYTLDTNLVPGCPSTLPPVSNTCQLAPWWDVANAAHGRETETDYYATDGSTLLKKTTAAYAAICPPNGASATPAYTVNGSVYGPWGSNQVSELDHNNPVAVCDVQQTQQVTMTYDSSASSMTEGEYYTYDIYGMVSQTKRATSSAGGSPTTVYEKTWFVRDDGLTIPPAQQSGADQSPSSANPTWWSGVYLVELPALETVEDSSGSGGRYSCHYTLYDGLAYSLGQTSGLTDGNVTEQDTYSDCGTAPSYAPSGKVGATTSFDTFGNAIGTKDPDATNGDTSHKAASGPCTGSTTCSQYDSTTQARSTLSGGVNNLTNSTDYGTDAASGYGLWPTSTTDANGQKTTYSYDALGRMLTMRAPGQSTGPATQTTVYDNWCPTTGASSPCVEVDTTRRTSSSTSVLTRQFYDGENRLVETRSAAPNGQDTVQYIFYNVSGQTYATSVSYFVPAYTGAAGSAAFSIPDSTQVVTTMAYDGLGRVIEAVDPLSNTGNISYSVVCNAPGTGDAGCYEQTLSVDPDGNQQGALSDGFGQTIYTQRYSGNSPATYAVYSTAKSVYDYMGRATQTVQPDGHSATVSSYDDAGRLTSVSDPDRGLSSYLYDSNGNTTEAIDARCGTTLPQTGCSAGTVYTGYDGLNRPIWRNNSNNPSGAYVTYSYDGSPFGNGLGRLTAEVFRGSAGTGATSFSGAYSYSYDTLGRTLRTNQTMGGAGACPTGWTCQDIGGIGHPGSQSYAGDGIWTVTGGGADIWANHDQFHFVSQNQSGDMTISAQVAAQTDVHNWAKSGLMVRATGSSDNAPFYDVVVTPEEQIAVQYRDTAAGSAATQATATGVAPVYLAITRVGTTYSAYTSSDGSAWTLIPGSSRTMSNLSGTVQTGLAVSAVNNATVSTATFTNVAITTGGAGACPTGTPTGWTCQDIGAPSPAGSQRYLGMENNGGNGVWTVSGSGADIWGTSDQFHYVSQPLSGDATLSAHVETQTNTSQYARAGLMVRGSSAANAPYYLVSVTPGNLIRVEYRDTVGGTAAVQINIVGSVPAYLRITRVGTTYTGYTSNDGTTWAMIAGSARTMSALSGTVRMGLAVTSHSPGVLSTATFDQLTLGSATMTPPGTVTTTAPAAPSGITSYPISTAYNDGSQPTSLTYSDNEVLSYGYDGPSGWLASLNATPAGQATTPLLDYLQYTGAGGAAGHPTIAQMAGSMYNFSASYDADLRLSSLSITNASSGATLFSSQRGYDAVGNVTAVGTTLAAGTDNQVFCYDDQHRLTWAGSAGTPNCGASLTPGSLTAASYTQTFTYDTLDRLQSGPLGSYSYGDTAHLHAVTSIGAPTTYSAAYDASGNMTCRAPTSSTTCSGTPTGAQLSYDNEGRLAAWQNAPSAPTTTDSFLYDGAGNRVEQQTTTNGSIITSTVYVDGGLEEITTSGASTTLTKYFGAAGLPTAERVGTNGPLSYLASDGQGTVSETLDGSGNVTSAQLYTPYGNVRYSSGSSPTSMGYTGQRADSATGLDFYHARYYDPAAGQFASADTVDDGLNRYGYVHGNPTTYIDPTGHMLDDGGRDLGGGVPSALNRNGVDDEVCNRHRCPPPRSITTSTSNDGKEKCQSDSTCGCYATCHGDKGSGGTTVPYVNFAEGELPWQCQSRAHQPDWCSRFGFLPSIHDADYWYVVVGLGVGYSVQEVFFFITALGQWFTPLEAGGGLGKGFFSVPEGVILTIGYGVLLTAGVPSGQQVLDFLGGISWGFSFDAIIGTGWVLSPGVGGWARQVEIGNQGGASVSGGVTGPDPCTIPQGYPMYPSCGGVTTP